MISPGQDDQWGTRLPEIPLLELDVMKAEIKLPNDGHRGRGVGVVGGQGVAARCDGAGTANASPQKSQAEIGAVFRQFGIHTGVGHKRRQHTPKRGTPGTPACPGPPAAPWTNQICALMLHSSWAWRSASAAGWGTQPKRNWKESAHHETLNHNHFQGKKIGPQRARAIIIIIY